MEWLMALLGIGVIIALGWALSRERKAIHWPTVLWALVLQGLFAVIILKGGVLAGALSFLPCPRHLEWGVIGLLAGSIGVVFATLLTRVLLPKMDIDFHVQWRAAGLTLLLAMVVTNGAGWAASFRLLGQKPLQVLREE